MTREQIKEFIGDKLDNVGLTSEEMENVITIIQKVGTDDIDRAEKELLSYAEEKLSEEKKEKLRETLQNIRETIDAFRKTIGMFFQNMLGGGQSSGNWDDSEEVEEDDTIDHEEL